jgi:hypothetical protein
MGNAEDGGRRMTPRRWLPIAVVSFTVLAGCSAADEPGTASSGAGASQSTATGAGSPASGAGGGGGSSSSGATSSTGASGGEGGAGSSPSPTQKICDLTGPGTSSKQYGVGGTDLGIPVRQPDGKIAYIFGDTFEGDGVGGPGWRSPVLLRSEPGYPASCIQFVSAAGGGYAKQILAYEHNAQHSTWLPSDAIAFGGRMYLHFMVNKTFGDVLWSEIAYSDDNGENWALSGTTWDGGENDGLRQLWTWERGDDGYVYTLSTKFSRDRGIILHRVPEGQLLDKNAYEPWGYQDNQWGWGNPATEVLPGMFGELHLRRVEDKWVLSWFNAADYDITIKVFDGPTANLHTATTYKPIQGGAWGFENDTTVAQLYGGYIHPDSTLHDLNLIVSQWNTETSWPYRAMQFLTGVE